MAKKMALFMRTLAAAACLVATGAATAVMAEPAPLACGEVVYSSTSEIKGISINSLGEIVWSEQDPVSGRYRI